MTDAATQTAAERAERDWAERVRANRDQVERIREVPDGADFYAPVTSLFRADPHRTDEPVLDELRRLATPDDVWLDVGSGAGRYALPLALRVREVVAIEPSAGMRKALAESMSETGIANVRIVDGRWPPEPGGSVEAVLAQLGEPPAADVALIAHVAYDIEAIGPFIAAMETAVRRQCIAVLMERQPASVADPFWPPVHGQERVGLPALPELIALLRARGIQPAVAMLTREPRRFTSREELVGFLRRQLWIADGGEKERRFWAAFETLAVESPEGWGLRDQAPQAVGVVTWSPPPSG